METRYPDRKKRRICMLIGIAAACILTGGIFFSRMSAVEEKSAEVQKELAEEVFRFHVLANSDTESDQKVKLKVRDAVLDYMKAHAEDTASGEETKEWAAEHLEELEKEAERVLKAEGCSYGARAEIVTCYFPEKRYGDITFPSGDYEALRINIGKARGENWWCVLYPNLCFMDSTCTVVSDEGKEELAGVLDEEEYEMVTASTKFKIKWFFLPFEEK